MGFGTTTSCVSDLAAKAGSGGCGGAEEGAGAGADADGQHDS